MRTRVAITSANSAQYIAIDGSLADWRWTRDFNTAFRFESRKDAESFATKYLPDTEVWYLGNLY